MSTIGRSVAAGMIMLILASGWLGPGDRAGATWPGTPTPAQCGSLEDTGTPGTPNASPGPEQATPIAASHESPGDHEELLAVLKAQGLRVETEEAIGQEFLTADRVTRLVLTRGPLAGPAELQVYAYDDPETLLSDKSQITPDGNLTTVMISWIATPHFFCGDQLIVLYLGDDQAAIDLLAGLFGPQFAGR